MQATSHQNPHKLAKCLSQRLIRTLGDIQKLMEDTHYLLVALEESTDDCPYQGKQNAGSDFNEVEVSQEALHLTLFVDYLKGLVEGRGYF